MLAVAPPKPYTDAGLAAFRKELAAVAAKKDRPALARLVIAQGFFWLKETGNAAGACRCDADKGRGPVDIDDG